ICISSVVAGMGNGGQSNYAAAKAGMEGFTRALAREVGSRGITVNAVAPGFIDTDMTRALNDNQRSAMLEQIPLGRVAQAGDIAAVVPFLAGESAGSITAATTPVTGGRFMGWSLGSCVIRGLEMPGAGPVQAVWAGRFGTEGFSSVKNRECFL